ncbi:MAG: exodeoxyribonuclease III [Nitrospinae bacterium]|nr:exodeoxyribonuclease III [Nitrospinota bacterium]
MKIVSWNVNGIRALLHRNLLGPFVAAYDPDVLCLQETKAQPAQVRLDLPSHPYHDWNGAVKKGYAGTALISKTSPLTMRKDMGVARHDGEGRMITAEFETFFVVSVYVPNAKRDLSRLADRQDWDSCFLSYVQALEQQKPVVCCGDFNVAHTAIDLARPKANEGQHGFTQEERRGFQHFVDAGFVDAFRHVHPGEPHHYTWWRQFGGARQRNLGWRIDYILISAVLQPRLRSAAILSEVYGSDHCPVAVELGEEPLPHRPGPA